MPDAYPSTDARLPEFYVDRMRATVTLFGANFTFGLSEAHPDPSRKEEPGVTEVVRLRMSLQHAKVAVMLISKQLRTFERESGATISIPKEVLQGLGLDESAP